MEQRMTAATLRCSCGQVIFCKLICVGERLGFLHYFNDETFAQQLKHCPRCAQKLTIHNLFASTLQQQA
jgi:hypothetical protein